MKKTYTQSAEEVLRDLGVGAEGLTTAQAEERLAKYGPNKLKEAEKPTLIQRFIEQLKDPMLIILMIAAAVSALTGMLAGENGGNWTNWAPCFPRWSWVSACSSLHSTCSWPGASRPSRATL